MNSKKRLMAFAALCAFPAAALAQNDTQAARDVAQQAQELERQAQDLDNQTQGGTQYAARDDDDGFDWGLLGLLGLAGLLGLKRGDRDRRDIHVDARNGRP